MDHKHRAVVGRLVFGLLIGLALVVFWACANPLGQSGATSAPAATASPSPTAIPIASPTPTAPAGYITLSGKLTGIWAGWKILVWDSGTGLMYYASPDASGNYFCFVPSAANLTLVAFYDSNGNGGYNATGSPAEFASMLWHATSQTVSTTIPDFACWTPANLTINVTIPVGVITTDDVIYARFINLVDPAAFYNFQFYASSNVLAGATSATMSFQVPANQAGTLLISTSGTYSSVHYDAVNSHNQEYLASVSNLSLTGPQTVNVNLALQPLRTVSGTLFLPADMSGKTVSFEFHAVGLYGNSKSLQRSMTLPAGTSVPFSFQIEGGYCLYYIGAGVDANNAGWAGDALGYYQGSTLVPPNAAFGLLTSDRSAININLQTVQTATVQLTANYPGTASGAVGRVWVMAGDSSSNLIGISGNQDSGGDNAHLSINGTSQTLSAVIPAGAWSSSYALALKLDVDVDADGSWRESGTDWKSWNTIGPSQVLVNTTLTPGQIWDSGQSFNLEVIP